MAQAERSTEQGRAATGPGRLAWLPVAALAALVVALWITDLWTGPARSPWALARDGGLTALALLAVAGLHRHGRELARAHAAALRAGDARLAAFARATFEGVVESEGGRVLDCNEQFARMMGYPAAALVGRPIAELVAPEDRERVRAHIEARRETVIEHAVVRPDGSRIDIEAHGRAVEPGSARRYTVLRDITGRRQAEEVLRRYELVAQQSRDVILFIRRVDGRILEANAAAAAAYGLSREELLARTVHDLRAPETRALTPAEMEQADRAGLLFETEHRRADGGTFPVEVSSRGATVGGERMLVSVVRDITERRRAREAEREQRLQAEQRAAELDAADRRKSEFLAMLSHELRNPLGPIRNGVFLLERAQAGSADAQRARDVIRRQVDHLARLVDDLLDVTRIAHGKIVLRREVFDLREIARRTAEDLAAVFGDAGVALRVEALPPAAAWVDADPTRIAQALGNLLQNAVKFTPAGGTVTLGVAVEGASAALRVRDDGAGIDAPTLARMFEPFAQGAQTLARTQGGLGLGLPLVKGLVELHGGAVEARSEGPGRGAEFTLRLPRVAAGPAPAAAPAPTAASDRALDVLVIEDNVDAGQSLADVLELLGHRARLVHQGAPGIALARELRPDVVLCDIGLPDVDGYAVARALRESEELRAVRLVALSGYARPEDRQRALEAGFDVHLAKPVDIDVLARALVG